MSRVLPIIFSTDMVMAILDGRKTVTRRCVKPRNKKAYGFYVTFRPSDGAFMGIYDFDEEERKFGKPQTSPYQPGDILYVRETWCCGYDGEAYFYLADKNTEREQKQLIDYDDRKWRPSIHMPKQAARIWLKVTDVRVERLHSMKLDDFLDEGVVIRPEAYNDPDSAYMQAKREFIAIWDSTIPKGQQDLCSWAANPWVRVIEFERRDQPEGEER